MYLYMNGSAIPYSGRPWYNVIEHIAEVDDIASTRLRILRIHSIEQSFTNSHLLVHTSFCSCEHTHNNLETDNQKMIFNHHSTIQSERQGPQLPNSQPMKWIWLSALLLLVTSAANFGIQLQQQSGNHVAYQSLAQGLCVEILASCGVSQDCSHMTTYQCSSLSSSGIQVDADGVVDMVFDAWVSEPFDECGELSCPSCTAYKSCVGPMMQTDQQMLDAGDCILWEYKTEGGSDAFEVGRAGERSQVGGDISELCEAMYTAWGI